jgi:hypothetical protein
MKYCDPKHRKYTHYLPASDEPSEWIQFPVELDESHLEPPAAPVAPLALSPSAAPGDGPPPLPVPLLCPAKKGAKRKIVSVDGAEDARLRNRPDSSEGVMHVDDGESNPLVMKMIVGRAPPSIVERAPSSDVAPRGGAAPCCQFQRSNQKRCVLISACEAQGIPTAESTNRLDLARLLFPDRPAVCEFHAATSKATRPTVARPLTTPPQSSPPLSFAVDQASAPRRTTRVPKPMVTQAEWDDALKRH